MEPLRLQDEPADDSIGRYRGELSTRTHLMVDGRGRPPTVAVAADQGADAPTLVCYSGSCRCQ